MIGDGALFRLVGEHFSRDVGHLSDLLVLVMWWWIVGALFAANVLLGLGVCRAAGRADRESERRAAELRAAPLILPSTFGLPCRSKAG